MHGPPHSLGTIRALPFLSGMHASRRAPPFASREHARATCIGPSLAGLPSRSDIGSAMLRVARVLEIDL